MTAKEATLQVWADVRCPWCWMGHRRLVRAIADAESPVKVDYRSFLLEPQGPATGRRMIRDVALTEWGLSAETWAHTRDRIIQEGRTDDLRIRIDTARTIDSRAAHRVLKLVRAHGLDESTAWDKLFAAHLEHNLDLEDWDQLASLGTELGLNRQDVLDLAGSDLHSAEVIADHEEAQSRGIHTIPTVVHAGQILAGAQSVKDLTEFARSASTAVV